MTTDDAETQRQYATGVLRGMALELGLLFVKRRWQQHIRTKENNKDFRGNITTVLLLRRRTFL
jgi:hypothetical protein